MFKLAIAVIAYGAISAAAQNVAAEHFAFFAIICHFTGWLRGAAEYA